MTRDTLITAMREGLPFLISIADGRQYKVNEPFDIALGQNTAYVVGEDGQGHVVPFPTITGLTYLNIDENTKS
jgi:hypothetical protein